MYTITIIDAGNNMANYIVIAASSSMGQATVELLKQGGNNIFTTARDTSKITPDAVVDAANFDALGKVFENAIAKLGKIDGVVNFAGSLFLKKAHFTSYEQYSQVIESSLTTAFSTVRATAQYIEENASVVLLSSAVANIGIPNHEAIAAAKAGVAGLMRSAAATYAERNLRFNAIAPGLVKSNLTTQLIANKSSLNQSLQMHPLHRIGSPEDIARAVQFLLDPKNSWITGDLINLDGGLGNLKTFSSA